MKTIKIIFTILVTVPITSVGFARPMMRPHQSSRHGHHNSGIGAVATIAAVATTVGLISTLTQPKETTVVYQEADTRRPIKEIIYSDGRRVVYYE